MGIENTIYFALGLLTTGVVALAVVPAVWRRAVRLTKMRIEAASPVTLAEFRADKDQLRAEFALSTRRLEKNVETLRARLAEQLGDINRKRSEIQAISGERATQLALIRELEERESELRQRVLDLERESTDLVQRLRMRDREYVEKVSQLETARAMLHNPPPTTITLDGRPLTGDYHTDVTALNYALTDAYRQAAMLEVQSRSLIADLEKTDKRASDVRAVASELRASLASKDNKETAAQNALVDAEARIASAEGRLNTALADSMRLIAAADGERGHFLAEKLALEDETAKLRAQVKSVEATIMAEWDSERLERSQLREKLNDIASSVGQLAFVVEGQPPDTEESLFSRVQKYAGEDFEAPRQPKVLRARDDVANRLAALRDIQRAP